MTPTIDQVESYFRKKIKKDMRVISAKRTFPGNSRETWIVQTEASGIAEGFVLRIDPPEGGGGPLPMQFEWNVYQRLFSSDVPVAEPLWYEENSDFVEGRPHMVRRLVEGSTTVDGLFETDSAGAALRRRVAFECVEKLSLVHRLDWKTLGFDEIMPAPVTPADCFRNDFNLWRSRWEKDGPVPLPVLEEALCWIESLMCSDTPRTSLVKGNNGLGEEIWRGEKIVAMSDWEVSHLGDGVSDLFWSQGTVRLIEFSEIVKYYGECMGRPVSEERLAFAAVYAVAKQLICALSCWYRLYHEGRTRRVYALSCRPYLQEFEYKLGKCIGKSLDEAWGIVNSNDKSLYAELGGTRS